MSRHTPGPWFFVAGNQIRSALHQIARVWMMRNGEGLANARLIAAAPEMLKALQRLTHPAADDDDLAYALEVIIKATGGQS